MKCNSPGKLVKLSGAVIVLQVHKCNLDFYKEKVRLCIIYSLI